MENLIAAFKRKSVQGLYAFDHFERADGAWVQRSIDFKRKELTFCARDGAPFQRFAGVSEFNRFLEGTRNG